MKLARSEAKGTELAGVALGGGRAGDPGLLRPRQRIAGPGLAERNGLGHRHGGVTGELARGIGLAPDQCQHRVRVGVTQWEARRKVRSDAEDRVDRARRADRRDRQGRPIGELRVDERANRLLGHRELVLVHAMRSRLPGGEAPTPGPRAGPYAVAGQRVGAAARRAHAAAGDVEVHDDLVAAAQVDPVGGLGQRLL